MLKREFVPDFIARVMVGALFVLLSINLLQDFMRTGRVTGLLLLASESLVVVLTIARRRAQFVDRSIAAGFVTAVSMIGPNLMRASGAQSVVPDLLTAWLSGAGLLLVIVGKLALGRSFGLVPANRGVVVRGPYGVVRHPIYAGYLITHLGFLLAYPALLNVILAACADTALVIRAMFEERALSTDMNYRMYCQRVAWHLIPGVF